MYFCIKRKDDGEKYRNASFGNIVLFDAFGLLTHVSIYIFRF